MPDLRDAEVAILRESEQALQDRLEELTDEHDRLRAALHVAHDLLESLTLTIELAGVLTEDTDIRTRPISRTPPV